MTRPVRELGTLAEVATASGDHPVVTLDIGASALLPAYAVEPAGSGGVALVGSLGAHPQVGLSVLGDGATVATLLAAPVVQQRIRRDSLPYVSVPRAYLAELEQQVDVDRGGDWDWMSTSTLPPQLPEEDGLVPLDREAADEVEAFLAEHSPRTHARPFHAAYETWVALRGHGGALLAVGSRERTAGGAPYLSGIAVATGHRGRGLGAAVTSRLTRDAVTEAGVCTLGVFADNVAAIGLYHRLGYRTDIQWASRWRRGR